VFHLLRVMALNVPRCTRAAGALLAVALGVIYGWVATHAAVPGYVAGLLLLACAGAAAAGLALAVGLRRFGWPLAAGVAGGCFVAYLASRLVTWPGFAAAAGAWHSPVGTLALLLEVGVGGLYVSLRGGWSIDQVGARDWETYYSRPRPGQELERDGVGR
jgi:hypothetical protein